MKLSGLLLPGLAIGQDLAFEDVFDHTCDATEMYASIRSTDLAKLGTWKDNYGLVTLNEGCPGEMDEFGNIIFSAGSLKNLPLECGTQYSDDGEGRITFWNVVQYTPPNDSPITRDASGLYNFSCIYDMSVNGQTFELSLAHKVVTSPVDTITFEGKSAEGKFRASMELFKNDGFKKKDSYKGVSVTLGLEERLFVEVSLEAADREVHLQVAKCWATPTTHADDKVRHTMINDGCPTNDNTVSLHASGDNNKARWEAQMFRFVEESEVWLHCDIKACDSRKYNCDTICPNDGADDAGRRRRADWDVIVKDRSRRGVTAAKAQDTAEYKANILTVGPMRSAERYEQVTGDDTGAVIGVAVVGLIIALGLVCGIVYACKFRGASNGKQSKSQSGDWQLYGANKKVVPQQSQQQQPPSQANMW
jgi:hypothetical protein